MVVLRACSNVTPHFQVSATSTLSYDSEVEEIPKEILVVESSSDDDDPVLTGVKTATEARSPSMGPVIRPTG